MVSTPGRNFDNFTLLDEFSGWADQIYGATKALL